MCYCVIFSCLLRHIYVSICYIVRVCSGGSHLTMDLYKHSLATEEFTYVELCRYRFFRHKKKLKAAIYSILLLLFIFVIWSSFVYLRAEYHLKNMKHNLVGDQINLLYDKAASLKHGQQYANVLSKITIDPKAAEKIYLFNSNASRLYLAQPILQSTQHAIDTVLLQNQNTLAAWESLPHIGPVRYPADFSQTTNISLSHLPKARTLQKLLTLRLLVNLQQGNHRNILNNLNQLIKLNDSLRAEPTFITQADLYRFELSLGEHIQTITKQNILTKQQLLSLQQKLQAHTINCKQTKYACLAYDFQVNINSFKMPKEKFQRKLSSINSNAIYDLWLLLSIKQLDRACYIQLSDRLLEQVLVGTNDFSWLTKTLNRLPEIYFVSSQLTVSPNSIYFIEEIDKCRTLSILSLAMLRYQLDHQSPPTSPEQLVPDYFESLPNKSLLIDFFPSYK